MIEPSIINTFKNCLSDLDVYFILMCVSTIIVLILFLLRTNVIKQLTKIKWVGYLVLLPYVISWFYSGILIPLLDISVIDIIHGFRTLDYQFEGTETNNWRPRIFKDEIEIESDTTDLNNLIYLADDTSSQNPDNIDSYNSNSAILSEVEQTEFISSVQVNTNNSDNITDLPATLENSSNVTETSNELDDTRESNQIPSLNLPNGSHIHETEVNSNINQSEDIVHVPVPTERDTEQFNSDLENYNNSVPELSWGSDSEEPGAPMDDNNKVNSSQDADDERNSYDSDPENIERDASVPESQRGLDSDDVEDALEEHVGLSRDFVEDVGPHQQTTRDAAEIATYIEENGYVDEKGNPLVAPEVAEQLRRNMETTNSIANRLELGVGQAIDIIDRTNAVGLMTPERDIIQTWSSNQQQTLQTAERLANRSTEILDNVLSGNPNGVHDPSYYGTRNASIRAWLEGVSATDASTSNEVVPSNQPVDNVPQDKTDKPEPKS